MAPYDFPATSFEPTLHASLTTLHDGDRFRILIASGGTGGHLFPALSLAERLTGLASSPDILFVTSRRGPALKLLGQTPFPWVALDVDPVPYRWSWKLIQAAMKSLVSVRQARTWVERFDPQVVVGFGGYVSVPVVIAARLAGCVVLLHEQNVVPGRANRWMAPWVDRVACGFPNAAHRFGRKGVWTGNPVRSFIFHTDRLSAVKNLNLDPQRKTLLVMGGSQGAHQINEMAVAAAAQWSNAEKQAWQMLHLAGSADAPSVRQRYQATGIRASVWEFLDNIGWAYCAADMIVSRSGALAVSEIAACAIPTIFVPYPGAGAHQHENARMARQAGAAELLPATAGYEILLDRWRSLQKSPDRLAAMRRAWSALSSPQAVDRLADEVMRLAGSATIRRGV